MKFLQVLLFAKKSFACDEAKSGGAPPPAQPQLRGAPPPRAAAATPRSRGAARRGTPHSSPARGATVSTPGRVTGRAAAHRAPRNSNSAACSNAASCRFLRAARRHPRRRQPQSCGSRRRRKILHGIPMLRTGPPPLASPPPLPAPASCTRARLALRAAAFCAAAPLAPASAHRAPLRAPRSSG